MQYKKKQFVDKGRNTLFNSYTENKFKNICCKLWDKGTALFLRCYFYIFVDILLGHYMLTCSSNRYSTKFSNLFIFKFKGEGPTYCMSLIFITCTDKQNQYNHFKTIKALQNKKPFIYIFSRLAFYLLFCWNLSNKPFSDFSKHSA